MNLVEEIADSQTDSQHPALPSVDGACTAADDTGAKPTESPIQQEKGASPDTNGDTQTTATPEAISTPDIPPERQDLDLPTTRDPPPIVFAAPIRRKRGKKKPPPPPKPVGLVGMCDSLEGFHDTRLEMNRRIPWFQENPIPNLPLKHVEVPDELNWDDGKSIHTCFPPWKMDNGRLLGTRQIPKCFILDAQTPHEKLLVVNWWKSMTKEAQTDVASKENIHRFYRAPMRSNSPYKYWHDVPAAKGTRLARGETLQGHNATNPTGEDSSATNGTGMGRASSHMVGAPIIFKKPGDKVVPGFRLAQSCQDLCRRFNLSVDQLYCARLEPNTECAVTECNYPALSQNRTFCCVHKQNWWPRTGLEHHQKRRGHFLLGPEYAVRPSKEDIPTHKTKVRPLPCGCSDPTCEGIGWSADMARIPKGYTLPPHIVPNAHRDKDRPLRLAPWHFPPRYRLQLPDGTWKMLLEDRKVDAFPDPIYDPKDFINEPGMLEYTAKKSPFLLPVWVYAMRAVEEGPLTQYELQHHVLRKQRDDLLTRLLWQSVEHHELSQEHQQAETKLEEMKRTHIHKRTLKRLANVKAGAMANKKGSRKRRDLLTDDDLMLKRRRAAGVGGDMMGFRPVNDLSSEGEMSDNEMEVHHHLHHHPHSHHRPETIATMATRLHDPTAVMQQQQFRDHETAALHEGVQAIQYLQHQPPHTLHAPHPTTAATAHHAIHPGHTHHQPPPPLHHPHHAPTHPHHAQAATVAHQQATQLHHSHYHTTQAPPPQPGTLQQQRQTTPAPPPGGTGTNPANSAFYPVGAADPNDLNVMARNQQQQQQQQQHQQQQQQQQVPPGQGPPQHRWGNFAGYR